MKKKIAILGSTGSIGKTLVNILSSDKKNFDVVLLTTKNNYKELFKQAKIFNVRNLIIIDKKSFLTAKNKNKNKKINIYNDFSKFKIIFKKKIDYTMCSISGIDGLKPTIEIIKFTKEIAIANKEAIICAWDLIKKELSKHKTNFIPVDSEHFSIWFALKNISVFKIEKIYLTASGGPLLNIPLANFKNLKISQVLKHPNWKMGKKISVDSSTMMNKVFEIIEAKKIFEISYKKLSILIHPRSYLHAIIKFNDGLIKIIAHDTTMKIPIFNSIYSQKTKILKSDKFDLDKMNNLSLSKVNTEQFPLVKILKLLPSKNSLFETILVSINDTLVNLYLKKKLKFTDIQKKMLILIKLNEFKKYKMISPRNLADIIKLNDYVRLKINSIYI